MVAQNPPPVPKKTDQQIADLSPDERDKYFQDQAAAGIHDGGLSGWVERMVAAAKAKAESDKVGDQNVKTLQTHHVEYVAGLHPSDADYMGHEHEQLKSYVSTNLDLKQVTDVSTAYHGLHEAFDGFGKAMKQAVKQTDGKWHGDAATSAQGYFSSLGAWADVNSANAKLASETIYDQQTAASSARNSMPDVVPFNMMDEINKWAAAPDTGSFAAAVANTYQTYQESHKAHDEAAHVMTKYDNDLYAAASKQPAFVEPPKFQPYGEVTPRPIGGGGGKRKSGETGGTGTSSSGFTGGNVGVPPGSGVPSVPPGAADHPPRSPLSPAGPSTGSGVLPGNTTPAGYQSTHPAPVAGNVPGASGNFGGMGAMPMGGMGGGFGGDAEYNTKLGRGGFGPGGSGGGSGSGSTPGAGNSSGAARPGGIGAAEAAAGRGMGPGGGAAGGRGGAGLGGMGAGRGQGGAEDQEHQRPTYLVEGDPDEIFGSDIRTAPPVIGE